MKRKPGATLLSVVERVVSIGTMISLFISGTVWWHWGWKQGFFVFGGWIALLVCFWVLYTIAWLIYFRRG